MINKTVENAAMLLTELKANPGMKLKAFCASKKLSLHFMEQIGRKLRVAGVITTKHGPGGGYSLKKEQVKLSDLLNIFMTKKAKAKSRFTQAILEASTNIEVI